MTPAATAPTLTSLHSARPRGGLSLTTLSALAILVAGLLIATQALFIPVKAQVAQAMMAHAWATTQATGKPTRPWSWADFAPVAKLSFPTAKKSVLALSDANGESLAFGPTLMAASAAPGQRGITVFAAHRDTHFAFVDQLKRGDTIAIATGDRTFTYAVIGHEIVRWDASGIHPADNGPARLALVTCWPLEAKFRGPLRYVVWAELLDG